MTPDTLAALAHYIEDQAVSSARVLSVTADAAGSATARMIAGDGSRWYIVAASHGRAFGWADTEADAVAQCVTALLALTISASQQTGEYPR